MFIKIIFIKQERHLIILYHFICQQLNRNFFRFQLMQFLIPGHFLIVVQYPQKKVFAPK